MSEQKQLTCISCPIGCLITVTLEGNEVVGVTGNTCPRGVTYAKAECTAPVRMVTGLVRVEGSREPLSVKTATAIPKSKVADCVKQLGKTVVKAPIKLGETIIPNICDTGIDIIATKEREA